MSSTTCTGNDNWVPVGSTNDPLVGRALLTLGLGNQGSAERWYLLNTDISRLPNPASASALSDSIIMRHQGYWPVTGTVYDVLGMKVSAATLGGWNYFTSLQEWNSVKNIQLTSVNAEKVQTNGFTHVDVNLGGNSSIGSEVIALAVKRGNFLTGHGNDRIDINVVSNETTWGNDFRINSGAGNDNVTIKAFDLAAFKCQDPYKSLPDGFLRTDGAWQRVFADLEDGNDVFNSTGLLTRDYVRAGNGNDVVSTGGGDDRVNGGEGRDIINGGSGSDVLDAAGNAVYANSYALFWYALYSKCSVSYANTAQDLFGRMSQTAERVEGGNGNDLLISTARSASSDGSDIFTGGAGADNFFFTGRWGFDVIKDFSAAQGDKLWVDGFNTTSNSLIGLYRTNIDGSNDDLLIVDWNSAKGSNTLDKGSMMSIVLEDFFSLNSTLNTAAYDNKLWNANQVAGLSNSNIFNLSQGEQQNVLNNVVNGNFFA